VKAQKRKLVTHEDRERMRTLRARGMTLDAISEATGWARRTVQRHTLDVDSPSCKSPLRTALMNVMRERGMTCAQVASAMDASENTVIRHTNPSTSPVDRGLEAPDSLELADVVERWGVGGAAIEYEVSRAQVHYWLEVAS